MTTRKHSRKKRNQKGIKWFYITAAGLVSAVILAAILFKIRADSADSQRPAGTSVSQKIAGSGDRAGDSPNEENRPDKGNQWNKTNIDNTNIRTIISQMSLEQKAAQLFIITPEALTGFQTVTQAGDATYKALQEYPSLKKKIERPFKKNFRCSIVSVPKSKVWKEQAVTICEKAPYTPHWLHQTLESDV